MLRALLLLFMVALSFSAYSSSLQQLQNELKTRQYANASTTGQALLQVQPDDAQTLFLTALAFQQTGQNSIATRYYQKLIGLHPNLPEPRNNLAMIYMNQGKYDEAIDVLVATLNTHPAYATAWENLKRLYQGLASEAYRKALSKDQDRKEKKPRSVMNKIQLTALTQLYNAPETIKPRLTLARVEPDSKKPPVKAKNNPQSKLARSPTKAKATAKAPAQTLKPVASAGKASTTRQVNPTQSDAKAKVTPGENPQQALIRSIKSWAKAWSAKDFDRYVAHYIDGYRDAKPSHRAWLDYRRARIVRPGFIRVEVDHFKVKSASAQRAIIDFRQRFTSPNYRDRVLKRLYLSKTASGWKISREKTLAVL
jgi:tetratricopeptide (TPR) repeat protein